MRSTTTAPAATDAANSQAAALSAQAKAEEARRREEEKAERERIRSGYKEKLQRLEGKDDAQSKQDRAMLKMALEKLGED